MPPNPYVDPSIWQLPINDDPPPPAVGKYGNLGETCIFDIFEHFSIFWVKYGIPEVREVSRKLPGARGFAVIEYGPVASHGDPIQARHYRFFEFANSVVR